jgi:quinol monooxygenase YgiN
MLTVGYTITPEKEAAFLEAMDNLRRSRRRTGASRRELYRDGDRPNRFVEMFSVPSWEEHEHQHEGRLTARSTRQSRRPHWHSPIHRLERSTCSRLSS